MFKKIIISAVLISFLFFTPRAVTQAQTLTNLSREQLIVLIQNLIAQLSVAVQEKTVANKAVTSTNSVNDGNSSSGLNLGFNGNGSVSPSGTHGYPTGSHVTISATSSAGFTFSNWTEGGNIISVTNPATITINGFRVIRANFVPVTSANAVTNPTTYQLSVSKLGTGPGTITASGISCSGGSTDCTQSYNAGSVITLHAYTSGPVAFIGWGGACASFTTLADCTLTMSAAKSVMATFNNVTSSCTPTTSCTVWTLCSGGTQTRACTNSCTNVATAQSQSCTVTPGTYTLNVTRQGAAGSVSKNPDKASYVAGDRVTLNAYPVAGYSTFTSWGGALSGALNPISLTMNSNFNVIANFTAIPPATPPPPTYSLNISYPSANTAWPTNSSQYLAWTFVSSQAPQNATAKVELVSSSGSVVSTLAQTAISGNTGVIYFSTPTTTGTYKIRMTVTYNGITVVGESATFAIVNLNLPTVTVTAPISTNAWPAGSTQTIRWVTSGGTASNVIIFLKTIAGNYVNNGQWTVPNSSSAQLAMPATSGQYRYEISANFGGVVTSGESPVFTVSP